MLLINLSFSKFSKIKQYQLFPVISMHIEKHSALKISSYSKIKNRDQTEHLYNTFKPYKKYLFYHLTLYLGTSVIRFKFYCFTQKLKENIEWVIGGPNDMLHHLLNYSDWLLSPAK